MRTQFLLQFANENKLIECKITIVNSFVICGNWLHRLKDLVVVSKTLFSQIHCLSDTQSQYDRYLALIYEVIGLKQKPDVQRKNYNNLKPQNF